MTKRCILPVMALLALAAPASADEPDTTTREQKIALYKNIICDPGSPIRIKAMVAGEIARMTGEWFMCRSEKERNEYADH